MKNMKWQLFRNEEKKKKIKIYNKKNVFKSNFAMQLKISILLLVTLVLEHLIKQMNYRYGFMFVLNSRTLLVWLLYSFQLSRSEQRFVFLCFKKKKKINNSCKMGAAFVWLLFSYCISDFVIFNSTGCGLLKKNYII